MSNNVIGTTPFLYVPRTDTPEVIRLGENYFFIQIHSAQAAYYGPVWKQSKGLAVVSKIDLNHKALSGTILALQHTRLLGRNQTAQLGLRHNLIDVVPATMSRVSISFDFILDRKNQLAALSKVINDGGLQSTLSLTPGMSLAAHVLSGLSQKIIENFIPAEDSTPLIQFNGDLNLAGEELQEGYYIILGSLDKANPLPSSEQLKSLAVQNGMLLINNQQIDNLSYIVLNVQCVSVRTRDGSQGAALNDKLREAEDIAQSFRINPLAKKADRDNGWVKIRNLIAEAQTLLRADPSYLTVEARSIIDSVYENCYQAMSENNNDRGLTKNLAWKPDDNEARMQLGISPDEDLIKSSKEYAQKVISARRVIKKSGLR